MGVVVTMLWHAGSCCKVELHARGIRVHAHHTCRALSIRRAYTLSRTAGALHGADSARILRLWTAFVLGIAHHTRTAGAALCSMVGRTILRFRLARPEAPARARWKVGGVCSTQCRRRTVERIARSVGRRHIVALPIRRARLADVVAGRFTADRRASCCLGAKARLTIRSYAASFAQARHVLDTGASTITDHVRATRRVY